MKVIKTTSVSALIAGLLVLLMTCNAYADAAGDPGAMSDNPGVPQSAEAGKGVKHRSYGARVNDKLLRGLANTFTGIIEIPRAVINATNYQGGSPSQTGGYQGGNAQNSNFIWGLGGGSIKGVVNFIGRTAVGLTDVLTFPFPTEPVANPVYPWQNFYEDTSYGPIFKYEEH